MDSSTRYRRVNEEGEWEYLCPSCDDWKPKERFRGCVDKVDGFGNCKICRSCISIKANKTRLGNVEDDVKIIMIKLGYEVDNPDNPIWVQFHKRHNLPY